jgi:hypothetical protein
MASDPQSVVAAVLKWRRALQSETGAARAANARLRRAASVLDALMLEETLDLIKAVRHAGPWPPTGDFEQRLVVLAMTLAHIETDAKTPLARALGQTAAGRSPAGDERPRLSLPGSALLCARRAPATGPGSPAPCVGLWRSSAMRRSTSRV